MSKPGPCLAWAIQTCRANSSLFRITDRHDGLCLPQEEGRHVNGSPKDGNTGTKTRVTGRDISWTSPVLRRVALFCGLPAHMLLRETNRVLRANMAIVVELADSVMQAAREHGRAPLLS